MLFSKLSKESGWPITLRIFTKKPLKRAIQPCLFGMLVNSLVLDELFPMGCTKPQSMMLRWFPNTKEKGLAQL